MLDHVLYDSCIEINKFLGQWQTYDSEMNRNAMARRSCALML